MTIRLLRTLVAVAETRTFTTAAARINVTHAAVSQQMRALEADLGLALFDRSTRTPELTPVARQVVARARVLIADYDGLVPAVLEEGGLSGTLTLGVLRTTLMGLMPRALAALKSTSPEIGLHLRPGLTTTLLAEVERGTLDAAVTSQPHLMPENLAFRPLAREPMQLIAPPDDPGEDPIALLRDRPFIRFDRGAVVGALIDSWILSNRIPVTETMELDSPEAITSMVAAGLGVSIVPDLAVPPPEAPRVRRLDLGPQAPFRMLGLVHRNAPSRPRAIAALQEALTQVIEGD